MVADARISDQRRREREEAYAALQRDNRFSQAIINSSLDGILAYDRGLRYTAWNPAMERLTGVPASAVVGQSIEEVSPFLNEAGEIANIRSALSGREVIASNRPFKAPEKGPQGYFDGHYSPLRAEDGEIVGGLAIIRDVTERMASERESRRRQKQLGEAQQIARLGSWEWDIANNVVHWSEALHRIYGTTPGSVTLTYEGFLERVHARDRARVAAEIEKAYREGGVFGFDHEIVRPDGTVRAIHARGETITDETGSAVRMIGTGQDITERRRVEERTRQLAAEQAARAEAEASASRMAFLADASTMLASSLDHSATISSAAKLMLPDLGDYCMVDLRDSEGRVRRVAVNGANPLDDILVDRLRRQAPAPDASIHPIITALQTGEPQVLVRQPPAKEGSARETAQRALMDQLGGRACMVIPFGARDRVLGAITLVRTTEQKAYTSDDLVLATEVARRVGVAVDNALLYGEAQEANRAKASFLAVMSHELRTPLNAILGYSDLLDANIGGNLTDVQHNYVVRTQASARHLLGLIEEILTYARVEAGREQIRIEPTDARDVARAASALLEVDAAAKSIEIAVQLPARAVAMETDAGKLRQILVNLLSNAVKFSKGGRIVLDVTEEPATIQFAIADQGAGIAPEHLPKIFDPFWQVDNEMTRRAGGTGLGLSVTQRLVQLLGGDISVQSEVGAGSTFTVRIPTHPSTIAHARERSVPPPS
jgi:PAS domain S-box-containing protein